MPTATPEQCRANALLASLSPEALARVLPFLEPVLVAEGAALHAVHKPLDALYFPITALVSFSNSDHEQRTAAVALAGAEALVGVGVVLGHELSIHDAVALQGGHALRLPRPAVREVMADRQFGASVLRFAHAFLTQISYTAVCERLHSVEKRLTRWLLLGVDLGHRSHLTITQDTLARLIGARREAVTVAAGSLQRAELIEYRRGELSIVDRPRLGEIACKCYHEIQQEYLFLSRQMKLLQAHASGEGISPSE